MPVPNIKIKIKIKKVACETLKIRIKQKVNHETYLREVTLQTKGTGNITVRYTCVQCQGNRKKIIMVLTEQKKRGAEAGKSSPRGMELGFAGPVDFTKNFVFLAPNGMEVPLKSLS